MAITTVQAEMSQVASGKEIRSLALQLADVKGAALNFADGQADAYDGDTLATKTNATYDGTNDYYSSPGNAITTASEFTKSGNHTMTPDGHISSSAMNSCSYQTAAISGDFDFQFTWTTVASTGGITGMGVSFVLASVIGGFNSGAGDTVGGLQSPGTNVPFTIDNNSNGMYLYGNRSQELSTTQMSPGDTFRVTRVSGVFTVYRNGGLLRTMTATSSANVHLVLGNAAAYGDVLDDMTFVQTVGNITLVSTPVTALAAPSTAFVTVQAKPVDSITLNTDLVAEVSRDGGTTWSTVTLTAGATNASFVNYEGSVDISGQPSGTSMVIRITTANNKEVQVSGHVLRWA